MKFQKLTLVDLSGKEWDEPKNNEKEIYEYLGRFIIEFESLASSLISTIEWIYFYNGMGDNARPIQIFLNREDISKLIEVHTSIIKYFYKLNDIENEVLNIWVKEVQKVKEYRNQLIHSKWATGFLSMTDDWKEAKVWIPKRRSVGEEMKKITKDDIDRKRKELYSINEVDKCIVKCLLTYKKGYGEYFNKTSKKDLVFDNSKWYKFLKAEQEKVDETAEKEE